ncbi:MAG: MAPEG family protein [Pikeienuella sp.]
MTPPVITAFYTGLNALIIMWLTIVVIKHRRRNKLALGDGGDKAMAMAIRGHANATEQIPMTMIMMGLGEMLGAPTYVLLILGGVYTFARLIHGLHFAGHGSMRLRFWGMLLGFIVTGLLALELVVHGAMRAF